MPRYSAIGYQGTNFITNFRLKFWQQNRAWFLTVLSLSPVAGGITGGVLLALGALSTFIAPPFGLIAYLTVIGIGAGVAFAASAILSSWAYFAKRNAEEENAINNKYQEAQDKYTPKEQPKISHESRPVQAIEKKSADKEKEESSANLNIDSSEIEKKVVNLENIIKKIDLLRDALKEDEAHSNVKDLIFKLAANKIKYQRLIESTSPSKIQSIDMVIELNQLNSLTILTVKALLARKQEKLNIFTESKSLTQNEIASYKQRIKNDFALISQDNSEFSLIIENINKKFITIKNDIEQLAEERDKTINTAAMAIQAAYQPQLGEDESELSKEKSHDEQAQTIINQLEQKAKERMQELRTKLSRIETQDLPSFLQTYLQQEKEAAEQYQEELILKMVEESANTKSVRETSKSISITPQSFFHPSCSSNTSGANSLDESDSDEAKYSDVIESDGDNSFYQLGKSFNS